MPYLLHYRKEQQEQAAAAARATAILSSVPTGPRVKKPRVSMVNRAVAVAKDSNLRIMPKGAAVVEKCNTSTGKPHSRLSTLAKGEWRKRKHSKSASRGKDNTTKGHVRHSPTPNNQGWFISRSKDLRAQGQTDDGSAYRGREATQAIIAQTYSSFCHNRGLNSNSPTDTLQRCLASMCITHVARLADQGYFRQNPVAEAGGDRLAQKMLDDFVMSYRDVFRCLGKDLEVTVKAVHHLNKSEENPVDNN